MNYLKNTSVKTLPFSPFLRGSPRGSGHADGGRWTVWKGDICPEGGQHPPFLTKHWQVSSDSTRCHRPVRQRPQESQGSVFLLGVDGPPLGTRLAVALLLHMQPPHRFPQRLHRVTWPPPTGKGSDVSTFSPHIINTTQANSLLTSRTLSGTNYDPTVVLALPSPNLTLYQAVRCPRCHLCRAPRSLLAGALRLRHPRCSEDGKPAAHRHRGDPPRARRRLSKEMGSRGPGVLAEPRVGQFGYEFIHRGRD